MCASEASDVKLPEDSPSLIGMISQRPTRRCWANTMHAWLNPSEPQLKVIGLEVVQKILLGMPEFIPKEFPLLVDTLTTLIHDRIFQGQSLTKQTLCSLEEFRPFVAL